MRKNQQILLVVVVIVALFLGACGGGGRAPEATATPAPTATPEPTATPAPTATPVPAESEAEPEPAEAADAPTPEVTIPQGFESTVDSARGYSLALPDGWTMLDLRSDNFGRIAGAVGLTDQLAPMNEFLESPEGDAIGVVAASDLSGMLFGGLPSVLNVSVIDAPDASPDSLMALVEETIRANSAALGDVTIEGLEATTVNNLPAVQAEAVIDLGNVGMDAQFYADVTALIANDKVYILTLATEAGNRAKKAAEFEQIVGTFRPE